MTIWPQQKLIFCDGSFIYINILEIEERNGQFYGIARPFSKDVPVKYIEEGDYWMEI